MRLGWIAIALFGCGRINFAEVGAGDGGNDRADASTWTFGTFSTPVMLGVSDPAAFDGDPSLTSDLLEIYFKTDRLAPGTDFDIFVSKRAQITDPWPTPTREPILSSTNDDIAPEVSFDGLTMWLTRGGVGDIYVSTRASRTAPWSSPALVTELMTATDEKGFGSATPDQLIGYMHSNRNGPPGIFRSTRASKTSQWSAPVARTELSNAGTVNENPWASPDDQWIAFASNRSGNGDIYMAHRPTPQAPFDPPVNLIELDTLMLDDDPWLSPDGHTIVFTRQLSVTNYDIYEATR